LNITKNHYGFTLVELLVVISIIAILAAAVILIINPLEFIKRGRDATRLKDLENLASVINITLQNATSNPVQTLCKESGSYPCVGKSNNSGASNRLTNGTGWVKADFTSNTSVTVPTLPIDPINDPDYHYTYCADADKWEINATLESDQLRGKMYSDGGNESDRYEVGSNYFLLAAVGGSCEY